VSHQSRMDYLRRIYPRYRAASRRVRGHLLDEFCEVTGYHRKYALRLLNRALPEEEPRRRRRRRRRYGRRATQALKAIWVAANYPWSVRLQALLPTWLPWARRRLALTPQLQRQLLALSPRHMDRLLQPYRSEIRKRLYGRTKPGTLLKHHIPVRTDRWDVQVPGFGEIDCVAHCGPRADGEFLYTVNFTDIHSTWVERRAVLGKSQKGITDAIDDLRAALPFSLRGLDADNGSEFINQHLWAFCERHHIQLTRGRPYKKNDNAHVEQKNWTHVRKLLGYVRYDSAVACNAINHLYRHELRLLQNLFLPSVKLLRKERVGSRVRRHYDRPQTPLERLEACGSFDRQALAPLQKLRDRLDPFALSQAVDDQLRRIYALATHRAPARSYKHHMLAPLSRWIPSPGTFATVTRRVTF
jgi:hypothetical protein